MPEYETTPKYETLKAEEYKYGNNFIEIALKKVEGTEFISVSKGFYNRAGLKKYKERFGFPNNPEIRNFFVKCMQEL